MNNEITTTAARFTHLISDERWGEICLVDDSAEFFASMEESMFDANCAAQKLAELQEIAAEHGEECEETLESIVEGWRDELSAALQPVEAVTLADGRTGWMTSSEDVYVERANGLASFEGQWSYLCQTELSSILLQIIGDSLIHNDRGNGCGGAGYEDASDVHNEIERDEREDENLTSVTESEDAEAWELARGAFRAFDLDPASIRAVYLGERGEGDNGHQMIYAI